MKQYSNQEINDILLNGDEIDLKHLALHAESLTYEQIVTGISQTTKSPREFVARKELTESQLASFMNHPYYSVRCAVSSREDARSMQKVVLVALSKMEDMIIAEIVKDSTCLTNPHVKAILAHCAERPRTSSTEDILRNLINNKSVRFSKECIETGLTIDNETSYPIFSSMYRRALAYEASKQNIQDGAKRERPKL